MIHGLTVHYQPTIMDYLVVSIRRHLFSGRSALAIFGLLIFVTVFFGPWIYPSRVATLIFASMLFIATVVAIALILILTSVYWRTNPDLNCKGLESIDRTITFLIETAPRDYPIDKVRTIDFLGRRLYCTSHEYFYPIPKALIEGRT
jgi:hypothetical protein